MINRVEKLSLLSEMIAFAKTDTEVKCKKYKFLLGVSQQLDICRSDFEYLMKHPIAYKNVESYSERIIQFHRLVLLMNLENERTKKELVKLYNFGLTMGLSHESINRVLYLMDGFPNKCVPPEVLIDIFKVQYN
ncbi:hypothetical protein [Formosa agariphila]|nr:hypothetical protein [Formosa agariphila]